MADRPSRPVVATVVKSFPPAFRSGGPGRSVSALTEALGDTFDFRVFTSIDDNGHDLRRDGIEVDTWATRDGVEALTLEPSLRSSRRMVAELRALEPDVLYLNSFFNPLFSIAPLVARRARLLKPGRTILAPRGEFSPGALGLKADKKQRFLDAFKRLGLGRGVVWHATSDLEADLIRQTIGPCEVVVAPVIRRLPVADAPSSSGSERLQLVLLSKIDRMKNLETALEALASADDDVDLTIAGPVKEPDYWAECQRLIAALGLTDRVSYHGPVEPDEVSEFLRQFDGFILPTRGENFGHVILEALAAGLPTIISDATQWSRLADAGAGWVCRVEDVAGFAGAIDELGSASPDGRAAIGRAAAEVARSYLTDDDTLIRNANLFGGAPALPSEVRVALVHYAFPVTTQTFHHRRARVMHEAGALAGIHYVNDAEGTIEERSSPILSAARRLPRSALMGGLFTLAKGPSRRLVRDGLSLAVDDNGEGGRRGFLWQALHGAALGPRLRATDATNIHAPFATASATVALFASAVSGLPLSIEVHSPISAAKNPALLGWKLGNARTVAVISEHTAEMVRSLCPNADPIVIHCGLDLDVPPARPNSGDSDIVAVGSLGPKKGHHVLIEASAELAKRVPHRVDIVGEGPLRDELQQLIDRLGAPVRLLGQRAPDETAALIAGARVGVLAAVRTAEGDEDGVPVALMEFMAAGVPVVSTDVAGIAELLDHGRAGAVVESRDAHGLAAALDHALTDQDWRSQMAAAGPGRVAESFDNREETGKLIAVLSAGSAATASGAGS